MRACYTPTGIWGLSNTGIYAGLCSTIRYYCTLSCVGTAADLERHITQVLGGDRMYVCMYVCPTIMYLGSVTINTNVLRCFFMWTASSVTLLEKSRCLANRVFYSVCVHGLHIALPRVRTSTFSLIGAIYAKYSELYFDGAVAFANNRGSNGGRYPKCYFKYNACCIYMPNSPFLRMDTTCTLHINLHLCVISWSRSLCFSHRSAHATFVSNPGICAERLC